VEVFVGSETRHEHVPHERDLAETSITGSCAARSVGVGPPAGRALRTASSSSRPRASGSCAESQIVASGEMLASIAARSPARNPA